MTLYRHFPSKDDLIVAVLNEFDSTSIEFLNGLTSHARTPRAKLLEIVKWTAERASAQDCRGCAFQRQAAEFPDHEHDVHVAALAHKRHTHAIYVSLARELGARKPRQLGDQLQLRQMAPGLRYACGGQTIQPEACSLQHGY